jgi:hypothetical protein
MELQYKIHFLINELNHSIEPVHLYHYKNHKIFFYFNLINYRCVKKRRKSGEIEPYPIDFVSIKLFIVDNTSEVAASISSINNQ